MLIYVMNTKVASYACLECPLKVPDSYEITSEIVLVDIIEELRTKRARVYFGDLGYVFRIGIVWNFHFIVCIFIQGNKYIYKYQLMR